MSDYQIITSDALTALQAMPAESVDCCITSPPYWGLRDYGHPGQMGLEPTPAAYVQGMVEVFREVRRVLMPQGTLWLNLGDSYVGAACGIKSGGVSRSSRLHGAGISEAYAATLEAGHGQARDKTGFGLAPKNLVGIPWRVAFALQEDGWWLRSDIIWAKPNPMPESVTDRPTRAHEYLFLLSKFPRYFYDSEAIKEDGIAMNEHDATGQGWQAPGQPRQTGSRDKQRGHSRRHDGFNDRWGKMTREEQCAVRRNKRDVWTIATQRLSRRLGIAERSLRQYAHNERGMDAIAAAKIDEMDLPPDWFQVYLDVGLNGDYYVGSAPEGWVQWRAIPGGWVQRTAYKGKPSRLLPGNVERARETGWPW